MGFWQNIRPAWDVLRGRAEVLNTDADILLDLPEYATRWAYYNNTIFADLTTWATLRAKAGLYRNIKPLYNPCRRVVRFYVGAVYPGALSEDGRALPDGWSLAVPLADDTGPDLKIAIAQVWQWTNFATQKNLLVRRGTALGDVPIEICDDVARGKIYFDIGWPGEVKTLILDVQGNVKFYRRVYTTVMAQDDGVEYDAKEIDKAEFRYYRGEKICKRHANPYGFVPVVWIRHEDVGSVRGAPALAGTYSKINYLMALASHIHQQVHKVVEGAMVLATDGQISVALANASKRAADDSGVASDAESIRYIKAPAGTTAFPLINNLSLADSLNLMQDMQAEIEADQPVLKMYDQLRSMSQLTGPAAERMVGDAANLLYEAQGQYDRGITAALQMAVAIGGMRHELRGKPAPPGTALNGWDNDTAQRRKFAPFNLSSYERGDLDFAIMPRPLLPPTEGERAQAKMLRWQGVKAAMEAGASQAQALADFDIELEIPNGGDTNGGQTQPGNAGRQAPEVQQATQASAA